MKDGVIDLSDVGLTEEEIRNISQIYIVACGSAYHVGMAAQYVLEDLGRIPVRVELASEFRYRNPIARSERSWLLSSVSPEKRQTALLHCGRQKQKVIPYSGNRQCGRLLYCQRGR